MISKCSPSRILAFTFDNWIAAMKKLFQNHWVVVLFLAGMSIMLQFGD